MISPLKSILKTLLRQVLQIPFVGTFVMRCAILAMQIGSPWLRRHPWRFLTSYKILHLAIPFSESQTPAANQSQNPSLSSALRAYDQQLNQQIQEYLTSEPNLYLVKTTNRLLAEYEAEQRVERAKAFPLRVSLELTSACNLRCRMCTQSLLPNAKRYYLDLALLDRLEPILHTANTVAITGWGETLLHRDFELIYQRVKKCGPAITMVSNGLLLTRETSEFLVQNGLSELTISLDAVKPETYVFVRGVNKLDQIKQNVSTLNEIRRSMGVKQPHVTLNFAMMRRNIAELPDFVRMAKDLGCDAVSAGFLIVYGEDMRNESLFYDKPLANRMIEEARAVAAEVGIDFCDMGEFDLDWDRRKQCDGSLSDSEGRYRSCRELWEFVYVNCIGEIFPCCWHQTSLGDLRQNTFDQIWNNAKYRAYRRGIQKSEPSEHCRHCMLPYLRGANDIENHVRIFGEDGYLLKSPAKEKPVPAP